MTLTTTISLRVLFFATLRDRAGTRSHDLQLPAGSTITALKAALVERFPGLAQPGVMDHCLASINHEYRVDETIIPDGAEVALFPPVSGG